MWYLLEVVPDNENKGSGRRKSGFYVGVAESQRENRAREKSKGLKSQQTKTSRSLCLALIVLR